MSSRPPADSPARPFEVAIVGNDAVLASLPSRPMQLAHALLACGFDFVVPVSWGEELLAEQALRALAARGSAPVIFCACPLQHARLLAAGSELAPHLLALVPPSVAAARYLRAVQPTVPLRITVLGGCPDADDASIDARIQPLEFLRLLAERGIVLGRQPAVFESVIPPDRRRFLSLPGGCPAPKALETRAPERRLVTITEDAFATELAESLLGREPVLVDVSPRLACACCGGFGGRDHRGPVGRDEILRHEPPRAPGPVLDLDVTLELVIDADGAMPFGVGRSSRESSAAEGQLPGLATLDQLRQRAERLRIAVTPARAVPTTRRASRAGDASAASSTSAAASTAALPTAAPTASGRRADAPPADADAIVDAALVISVEPVLSPHGRERVLPPPTDVLPPLTDLVVELPHEREGGTAAPADAPAMAPPLVATWRDAEVPHLTMGAVAARSADDASMAGMAGVLDAGAVPARRRAVSQVYQASRAQGHPRARSLGGKVLPRAYIRHAGVPPRHGSPTADVVAGEVEVPRAIAIEPLVAPASGHAVPIAAGSPVTGVEDVAALHPAPPLVPSAGDAPLLGDAPAPVTSGPIGAEVLARVRQQQHAPPRVIARDVTPPDDERDPGSLAVFIAAAILVVALLVAIGVVFRHAPTAPW